MGSEYLIIVKSAEFDEVKGRLQGAPRISKGIERLCGDLTPLRKKVEDYGSAVSAFSSLRKQFPRAAILLMWRSRRPCALSRLILRAHTLPWSTQILMPQQRNSKEWRRRLLIWRKCFALLGKRSVSLRMTSRSDLPTGGCWERSWCEIQGSCWPWDHVHALAWWCKGAGEAWTGHASNGILTQPWHLDGHQLMYHLASFVLSPFFL